MSEAFQKAREFILTNARLLERKLFQVRFEGASPASVVQVIRAYQNADGGLGSALEPDLRCAESQPIFIEAGLAALKEAEIRDAQLARGFCDYLKSVSDDNGLVPMFLESAKNSPRANHMQHIPVVADFNPTVGICGLLHYQGIQDDWLNRATETCCKVLMEEAPLEAHSLLGASRLAENIPDRKLAKELFDAIASALPKASFYIPYAPIQFYGLTPLDYATKPGTIWSEYFSATQIEDHLKDLLARQLEDGGWPINWDTTGKAAESEWRGRWTLNAICRLVDYGVIEVK